MDNNYLYYNKNGGSNHHIESQGSKGINNYKLIAENIYKIYKNRNDKKLNLVLEHVNYFDKYSSSYKFIITTEKDWVDYYNKKLIVGYFNIEPSQKEGKYYVNGRVKSDSNYCCLNKIIENEKVLF